MQIKYCKVSPTLSTGTATTEESGREELRSGEVYVFSTDEHPDDESEILWGVFDLREHGGIRLESSSRDLKIFELWHELPERFRYYRETSREELKEYIAGLTIFESSRPQ